MTASSPMTQPHQPTAPDQSPAQMQAMIQTEYGGPDVLHLATVDRPTLQPEQVLVKVRASSVNASDWHLMRGTPFLIRLMFGGMRQPKIPTLGADMAGEVVAVGAAVTQWHVGDAVFGDLSDCGFGAFADYVAVPETALVAKPINLSFEEAAAVPAAAIAALQAVRDRGQLQPGQKVLVNGASGGVGSFALQIAKALGGEVTAVCSTAKIPMVQSLNPDHIIDYTQQAIPQSNQRYDLILDAAAFRSPFDYGSLLNPNGTYVLIGGSLGSFLQAAILGPWVSKIRPWTMTYLAVTPNQRDLQCLKTMVEAGEIMPKIDRNYPLSQVSHAVAYLEARQAQGKVVIRLS